MHFTSIFALVLYFDGSLRYPSDPGFPSEKQQPRAACAACLVDDGRNSTTKRTQVLLLGGRLLQPSSRTTSGEVEYQGLLLGLERLLSYFSEDKWTEHLALLQDHSLTADKLLIRVCGDCKTVLQQMEGVARPRKLEPLYERAQEIMREIDNKTCSLVEFRFEHIPRNMNQLCDQLAVRIIQEQQWRDYHGAVLRLQEELDLYNASAVCSLGQRVASFMEEFLTMQSNSIPYSKRPPFYRCLAKACYQNGDFASLVRIGERWEAEVEQIWPQNGFDREELLVEATVYQIQGLRHQRRKMKHTVARQRKRQFLLKKWMKLCHDVEERLRVGYVAEEVENLLDAVRARRNDIESFAKAWSAEPAL